MYVGGVLNCGVETLQACLIGIPLFHPNPQKKLLLIEILPIFYVGKTLHMGTFSGQNHKLKIHHFNLGTMVRGLPLYHIRCVSLATWLGAN